MAKILIVDDHAINREFLVTLVGYDDHQALEASDGAEALAMVHAAHPDLVICDILMPTMDGYEFVRRLRADPLIADTKVMFYTANYHQREARNLAEPLGVSHILVKPCAPEEIFEAIDQALSATTQPAPESVPDDFDREHLQLITNKLAAKADELERANQRLAALTELNLKLAAESDVCSLLEKVCQGARELTGARYAILCMRSSTTGAALCCWRYGFAADVAKSLPEPAMDHGVFGQVMASHRPVRFNNPGGRPERIGLPVGFPQVYCGVAAPIASTLSVFGWVCLLDKVGATEFTEEDEWISGAHAAQAGQIYETRNLCAQLEHRANDLVAEVNVRKRTESHLQRVLRARKVMAECNRTLVRASDESTLLADMCRFLVEIGKYSLAWVGLVRHDALQTIETAASAGDGVDILEAVRLSWEAGELNPSPAGEAIRTGRLQVIRDIAADPGWLPWSEAALRHGFNSAIILPLKSDGETFGVLCIIGTAQEAFDADEIEMLIELVEDIAFGLRTLRARELQKQMEAKLRLRTRAIEESINAIVISECRLGGDNPVIYANPAFTQMTGYTTDEISGRNLRILLRDDWEQPGIERLRDAIRRGGDAQALLRNYRKDGTLFWNEVSLASVHDHDGRVSHFISVFNDLTDRKRYESELEEQATHDSLTGLANRNLLNDRMAQAMIHANRNDCSMAVMLLDLDRFKLINDSLGHVVGDALLQEVARRLRASVRQEDTVARLGGDEFMIVVPEIRTDANATTLARKVLDTVALPVALSGHEMVVTASLGISLYPRDGALTATLLKNADVAMYRAKEGGSNRFAFYAPEMNARMLERLELESELRRALERDELELHYQPKLALSTGMMSGAEALIRWRHPTRGTVSPADFIPLAEETGLIVPVGEWVIDAACRQLREWRRQGLPAISVAVNVSARQFQHESLASVLERALRLHDIPPHGLHLEVTESAVMNNPDRTIATLHKLRTLGVRVSLDDFGTGYSSLNYLKRFPIDSVKIDQTFITDVATSPEDAAIALMVITLGHSLGQTVIAEGVETEAQLDFLRRNRCDEVQGYLFSKPLPAREFTRLLRDGTPLTRTAPSGQGGGQA